MTQSMTPASRLRIVGRTLELNGQELRLFSGAMHYFRTLPEQWDDRLLKLKSMGLNCIETYVPWNMHQPSPESFNYQGLADLPAFIAAVGRLGMHVIVRPGPYICAEWEFGGLPAWLLADDDLHLRTSEPRYLAAVDRFFQDLVPRLLPYAAENGGPLIAMQVENEYGSYGRDKSYLAHLADKLRGLGYQGLLFTSDGPTQTMLENGTLQGIWKTANFGSRADEGFDELDRHEAGPRMVMEFWNGWFDHWGEEHHTRSAVDAAESLDEILTLGAHVNLYMGHGGTNFGFWSGANTDAQGRYQPTITSYDYDCPLTEAGEVTEKYRAFQTVLAKHGAVTSEPSASRSRLLETETVATGYVDLWRAAEVMAETLSVPAPLAMEKFGQNSGYVLYRTTVSGLRDGAARPLRVNVRDRAHVFVDGRLVGIMDRDTVTELDLTLAPGAHRLDLLVENQGRVNYGRNLRDRKGLLAPVWLDYTELTEWQIFPLPLDDLSKLQFGAGEAGDQGFHRFAFDVATPADSYLDLSGWGKGVAFINGFNLGRYWEVGPQLRLYLPWPLLRQGENELIVFETERAGKPPSLVAEQLWLRAVG
nr:beta-galactosidase [uncultured Devosia sp.]